MKVKCKSDNHPLLIKDEWYQVIKISHHLSIRHVDEPTHYLIQNHTHKKWKNTWIDSKDFYTSQEIREQKLNQLEI